MGLHNSRSNRNQRPVSAVIRPRTARGCAAGTDLLHARTGGAPAAVEYATFRKGRRRTCANWAGFSPIATNAGSTSVGQHRHHRSHPTRDDRRSNALGLRPVCRGNGSKDLRHH